MEPSLCGKRWGQAKICSPFITSTLPPAPRRNLLVAGGRLPGIGNDFLGPGDRFLGIGNGFLGVVDDFLVVVNHFGGVGNDFLGIGNDFLGPVHRFGGVGNGFLGIGNHFLAVGNRFLVTGNGRKFTCPLLSRLAPLHPPSWLFRAGFSDLIFPSIYVRLIPQLKWNNKSIMAKITDILEQMKRNPKDVRFSDLCKVCECYFGEARQRGSSHRVYKTPWQGDPRVNIQNHKGKAKAYQVKQVLRAIERLEVDHGFKK